MVVGCFGGAIDLWCVELSCLRFLFVAWVGGYRRNEERPDSCHRVIRLFRVARPPSDEVSWDGICSVFGGWI